MIKKSSALHLSQYIESFIASFPATYFFLQRHFDSECSSGGKNINMKKMKLIYLTYRLVVVGFSMGRKCWNCYRFSFFPLPTYD